VATCNDTTPPWSPSRTLIVCRVGGVIASGAAFFQKGFSILQCKRDCASFDTKAGERFGRSTGGGHTAIGPLRPPSSSALFILHSPLAERRH
jgi:hypothetical protein